MVKWPLMLQLDIGETDRRVLHIGGNPTNARMIQEALSEPARQRYTIDWAETLSDGLEQLAVNRICAVLMDLNLLDLGGEGLEKLLSAHPNLPVLVVGMNEDRETARQLIQAGAFEYLPATHLDSYWLPRALHHAVAWKQSKEARFGETERTGVILNSIGGALVSADSSGRVTYLNSIAETMTGWPRVEAEGRPLAEVLRVVDGRTRAPVGGLMDPLAPESDGPNVVANCMLIRRDGSEFAIEHSAAPVRDSLGLVTGTTILLRDVSAAHAASVHMSHLASHDPLTDLPNRLLLGDRLDRALALAQRYDRRLAVMYLDIDHFKEINDSLGHSIGDQLLQWVAREVTKCVRSSDTVSRHGGDEFVIVLAELAHAEDAAVGARKIIAALTRPYMVADHEVHISVSLGISVYPNDGLNADTLLKCADMALYHAKDKGRNCFQFFEPALNRRAGERESIEASLRGALERQEFELFYQPKCDLQTRAVIGAEALIRWRRPGRGWVEAAQFVGIAEHCGLIRPIGRWVVREACRQARAWQDDGLRPMAVSINVSSLEFRSKDFVANVVATLADTRLDPRYLELELTESVLMADVAVTASSLCELKDHGVQLAIDNFGVGSSSLSHLRHFPVDVLKIDKSFVQEVTSRSAVSPIVSTVIGMGKTLKHRVIATGVETLDQLSFLQDEGCHVGQGFYLGRPGAALQFAPGILAADESNREASDYNAESKH